MRWFTFNRCALAAVLLFLLPCSLHAQALLDSVVKQRYISTWSSVIPTHVKVQYAGDMGVVSVGSGWDYGGRRQWETNLFIGFLNKTSESPIYVTATLKQTYKPFRISIGDNWEVEPVTAGLYMTKIFGSNFWSRLPERYPRGYYFWILNMRFNVFLGQAITFKCPRYLKGDSFSFFYELNTNDLYVISAVKNSYLGFKDIVNLSFGVKFTFL